MLRLLVKISRALFGWPPRPARPEQKHALVKQVGQQRGIRNLVETGTFEGDMVEAQRENFASITTIELGDELYARAKQRFERHPQVRVLHGDSARMLAEAVKGLAGPAIFWLDAHYSKGITARGEAETPVLQELLIIAGRNEPGDVILIDDARHFGLHPGYPRLGRVRRFVEEHWPRHSFSVETDVIRIIPSSSPALGVENQARTQI